MSGFLSRVVNIRKRQPVIRAGFEPASALKELHVANVQNYPFVSPSTTPDQSRAIESNYQANGQLLRRQTNPGKTLDLFRRAVQT